MRDLEDQIDELTNQATHWRLEALEAQGRYLEISKRAERAEKLIRDITHMNDLKWARMKCREYLRASNVSPTLRDQFAMAALTGLLANTQIYPLHFDPDDHATYCYALADAMLKAREVK